MGEFFLKIDFVYLSKFGFEFLLDLTAFTEVKEIVDKEAKVQGGVCLQ